MSPYIYIITRSLLAVACLCPGLARAQLQLLPDHELQEVFAGGTRLVRLIFCNPHKAALDIKLRTRLYQAGSATVIPLGAPREWKELQLLPGQTVLESISLDFPNVKAETKFLVQWLADSNRVIGTTEILVYPTNLLAELKLLADGRPLGVFDPQNQLKPILNNLRLDFADLADCDLENFSGRLAIIGPFESRAQMREGLAGQVKALTKRNVAVVWLQPPPEKRDKPSPSFYSVLENTNAVVVVQADLVPDLAENPRAQLDLVYFCKLALHPEPFRLPDLASQP
jgi:hypothetical protein